jgi:hypothetical protein
MALQQYLMEALIAAFLLLAAFVGLRAFVTSGHKLLAEREKHLLESNYFLGQHIDQANIKMGKFRAKYPRWLGLTDYIWGYGDLSFFLRCDQEGRVVDYCPVRAGKKQLIEYFQSQKDNLIGMDICAIEKHTGAAHDESSGDHGEGRYVWRVGKDKEVVLSSQNGNCTAVDLSAIEN